MRNLTLLFVLFFAWNGLFAQRESTGKFSSYYKLSNDYSAILIAPGTMGPNALPVPEILNGQVGTDFHFKLSVDNYFRDGGGDDGYTLKLNFRFPVVQHFMALECHGRLLFLANQPS